MEIAKISFEGLLYTPQVIPYGIGMEQMESIK